MKARGNIQKVDDKRAGELALPDVMPRLTETPGTIEWAGRALGADTQQILRDALGLSDAEMEDLRDAGAI